MQPHISPTITKFLIDLSTNNKTEWMHAHKEQYNAAKSDFDAVLIGIIDGIKSFDSTIKTLEPKQCTYRINRDIRFSKDKSPYKQHFGGFITPQGKKWEGAGYYLHVEPMGESFLAAGNYCYAKNIVEEFRKKIVDSPYAFLGIQEEIEASKLFSKLEGEQLKRVPPGFDKENPNADLLKFKSYGYRHTFTKKEITSKNFVPFCTDAFAQLQPFVQYLNKLKK